MRLINVFFLAVLAVLQYPLWVADGSVWTVFESRQELNWQHAENKRLSERNARLIAEVDDLRAGVDAIEERARMDLSMVKQGEIFFQVIK